MSVDGFPTIIIPLEQQHPSVHESIWSKNQPSSIPQTELLEFQSDELHILLEAICALNPSLHIPKTTYHHLSPINCHSPCHDLYVDDSSQPTSDHTSYFTSPNNSHQNLHSLSMARVQSPGYRFAHPWEPSALPSRCAANSRSKLSPPQVIINSNSSTSTTTPSSSSTNTHPFKTTSSTTPKQPLHLNQHSNYWPKKTRSKKTNWLLQNKTSKTLDTIPENQELKIQNRYRLDTLPKPLLEPSEPKSVFENDSDSEDDIDD